MGAKGTLLGRVAQGVDAVFRHLLQSGKSIEIAVDASPEDTGLAAIGEHSQAFQPKGEGCGFPSDGMEAFKERCDGRGRDVAEKLEGQVQAVGVGPLNAFRHVLADPVRGVDELLSCLGGEADGDEDADVFLPGVQDVPMHESAE